MLKKILTFLLVLGLFGFSLFAQRESFRKVTKEALLQTKDDVFPDAPAVILHRNVENEVGNYIEVYERIKIFSKEGYDYATIEIPHGNISQLSGVTYNYIDGEIVETKLGKTIKSGGKSKKIRDLGLFTFPQVMEGSIVEYSYKASRGTFYDIPLQFSIPIKNIGLIIRNNSSYNYDILQNPRALLDLDINVLDVSTYIQKSNIPALEYEPFVYDIDLYRSKVEISTTGRTRRSSFSTFKKYVENLLETDDFINGYKPVTTYKKDLKKVIGNETDQLKIINIVYDFVRNHKVWNGDFGIYPDNESARFAYKDPTGDAADINMLLISMLQSLGISAQPILVSSKYNGLPITPSFDVFNYVIAGVYFNDRQLLLDAAHNKANFNLLPRSIVNWKGLRINDNGTFDWIDLTHGGLSKNTTIINAQIDEDLILEGESKSQLTGYSAMDIQSVLKNISTEKYIEFNGLEKGDYEIEGLKTKMNDTINHKTNWEFQFVNETAVESLGDKLYMYPLLYNRTEVNPFKKDERKFPIDFGFPQSNTTITNWKIPVGYKVESMPKSTKILIPNGVGEYLFDIKSEGNSIKLVTRLTIHKNEVPALQYLELQNFYKLKIDKESEKIVLKKL